MDENTIRRVQPHNEKAEQGIVGTMLVNRDAISDLVDMLTGEDFYNKQYGILFDNMVELYSEGASVDPITLVERLRMKDIPEEVANTVTLAQLVQSAPLYAPVKDYAKIVKDKAALRQLIKLCENTEKDGYQSQEPVEVIMERAEQSIFKLVQNRNGSEDTVPIREIVMNVIREMEEAARNDGKVTGVPTGFRDLDNMLTGMHAGELLLVAARPAMGKTAFVLNIAQYMAFKKNKAVAIFSLEMSKEQLVNRLFSLESQVDAQSLRTGNMKDSDWEKLIEGAGVIGQSKLIIDDTPGISISELRSKCRKYKLEHGLDIIIIDYLQLMTGSVGKSSESRQQEVSDISRQLKGLARELNVPVVSLSQLSRAVESRPDKRPMLSDLRESGAIEQDADVVMFIYRDEYYNKDSEFKKQAEIIIAKQRNGPVGTVNLAWLGEYTKFANLSRQEDSF